MAVLAEIHVHLALASLDLAHDGGDLGQLVHHLDLQGKETWHAEVHKLADDTRIVFFSDGTYSLKRVGTHEEETIAKLADGPTFAYAATKLLLTREADMSLQSAIELEAWTQAYLMRSADHAEFFRAQAEKRPPAWTGR